MNKMITLCAALGLVGAGTACGKKDSEAGGSGGGGGGGKGGKGLATAERTIELGPWMMVDGTRSTISVKGPMPDWPETKSMLKGIALTGEVDSKVGKLTGVNKASFGFEMYGGTDIGPDKMKARLDELKANSLMIGGSKVAQDVTELEPGVWWTAVSQDDVPPGDIQYEVTVLRLPATGATGALGQLGFICHANARFEHKDHWKEMAQVCAKLQLVTGT